MPVEAVDRVKTEKIVPLFRKQPAEVVLAVANHLNEAGFHTVEITMESYEAVESIRQIKRIYPEFSVGAGTVKTIDDAERALAAGADFVVTPMLNSELVKYVLNQGIPVIPGAFTPSEILKAYQLGAPMVKVFPAVTLGSGFIKNIKGPMSEIPLMATGGINLANAGEFLSAGVDAVGIGSSLIPDDAVRTKNWQVVHKRLEQWKQVAGNPVGQLS